MSTTINSKLKRTGVLEPEAFFTEMEKKRAFYAEFLLQEQLALEKYVEQNLPDFKRQTDETIQEATTWSHMKRGRYCGKYYLEVPKHSFHRTLRLGDKIREAIQKLYDRSLVSIGAGLYADGKILFTLECAPDALEPETIAQIESLWSPFVEREKKSALEQQEAVDKIKCSLDGWVKECMELARVPENWEFEREESPPVLAYKYRVKTPSCKKIEDNLDLFRDKIDKAVKVAFPDYIAVVYLNFGEVFTVYIVNKI